MVRPTRCAAWNMVGEFISVSISPVSGFSQPSRSMLRTDWLIERLPADAIAMMRSPGSREHVQLAEGGDVVDARIGAGVGKHHQAVAHQNSAAIGHDASP